MPHALFLGSSLAGIDRLDMCPRPPVQSPPSLKLAPLGRCTAQATSANTNEEEMVEMKAVDRGGVGVTSSKSVGAVAGGACCSLPEVHGTDLDHKAAMKKYKAELKAFDRIRWTDLHIWHATADTITSLLGFALTINAAILTLAGAAFYYQNSDLDPDSADLFGAHALIKSYIGNGAAIIFALALLCAGQSASITCTLAGQVVSEGFINWRVSPLVRRVITRCIGVVPAAIVAAALGEEGLNTMLVASQVVLLVVLPTVIFPLVYLCSQKGVMTVNGPEIDSSTLRSELTGNPEPSSSASSSPSRKRSYVSARWVTILGYVLTFVVVLANVYVFVQLGRGQ